MQINYNNINNDNKIINNYESNKDEINNINNQNFSLKSNFNSDDKITNIESYDFSSLEQNYVILASNERKTISINNIYSILNSDWENHLYENYFPVSFSDKPDYNKLISLLDIIIENRNDLNDPLGNIISHIFKFILENQLNLEKINILANGELKNKILLILSQQIQKEHKDIISINNLFNIETLYNQSNSNINCNIASVHPLEFMLNLFHEKILNKNNILYLYFLLLNMKENNESYNHSISDYDYIFENFECALFLMLKYFGNDMKAIKNVCNSLLNSFSSKINFCHYVILNCLLGCFGIKNGKGYGNIFAKFLQFPSIEKIIIADIYNFILYIGGSTTKKVIAKSSILIKYKYSLLKQNNKPEKNLLILNQKIYENISQFGSISKDNYFLNHLKEFSNKKLNITTINKSFQKPEENIKNNFNKKEEPQQQGLFSKFINVFGFGGSVNNNESNFDVKKLTEEERKRMDPIQLWKLEHPGEKESEYDPILKRYRIRGVIYNDQEEVIKKKEMEKPMVAPPKSKNYKEKKKTTEENNDNNVGINMGDMNNNNSNNNKEEDDIFGNKNSGMSGGPGSSNNRINNPFGYSKVKTPNVPKNNQKQNNKSLSQRYAVGYKK